MTRRPSASRGPPSRATSGRSTGSLPDVYGRRWPERVAIALPSGRDPRVVASASGGNRRLRPRLSLAIRLPGPGHAPGRIAIAATRQRRYADGPTRTRRRGWGSLSSLLPLMDSTRAREADGSRPPLACFYRPRPPASRAATMWPNLREGKGQGSGLVANPRRSSPPPTHSICRWDSSQNSLS